MAEAPLSRIVIITEDGSTIRPTEAVTIPPFIPTMFHILGTSTRIASTVRGFPEVVAEMDRRLTALGL